MVIVAVVAQDLGLRDRKKADTRRALSDAALELAFEVGLENVTREAIANRAGVSLRTFTNYFADKYEAIAHRQLDRLRQSLVLLRTGLRDRPLWVAVGDALLEPLEGDGMTQRAPTGRQLVELRKMLLATKIRGALADQVFDEWVDAIAERTGTDPAVDMYPRLVAAVVRAVMETAIDTYAKADPPCPIGAVVRQGLAAVAAGLPAPNQEDSHE